MPRVNYRVLGGLAASAVLLGVGLGLAILRTGVSAPGGGDFIERVADPRVGDPVAPRVGAPNIVLVIGCTVRKDQTSLYGEVSGTTPFLEELAATGVAFDDVIAAAPWTKAASSAILTGNHPLSIGMVEPKGGRNDRRLPPSVDTLAVHLRRAGYRTIGATANPNLNAIFGFSRGFDEYIQLEKLWREDMAKLEGTDVLRLLAASIKPADPEQPTFLQVMLVDAHAPFEPEPGALVQFADPSLPAIVVEYRAALLGLDSVVRSLHSQLGELGYDATNTLFVMVSDHGEGLEFPETHGKAHGRFLFPTSVGAVWLMSGPGIPAGLKVGGVASQVDVLPTLLGLAEVDGYRGPGLDLSRRIRMGATDTQRAMAFTDTWFINVNRAAVYTSERSCQRDFDPRREADKLNRFREGCFDRRTDPQHTTPLPNSEIEAQLLLWRKDRQAEYASAEAQNAAPGDHVEGQLEALGYLD